MKFDVTISIVLYKTDVSVISDAIASVYKTKTNFKLYLIDNSPTDQLKTLKVDDRCEYIHVGKNLGFGKAHNIAIGRAINESKYHLVLNPDVYFDSDVIDKVFAYMEKNPDVGQLMPKVKYPDGNVQLLCKLLPAPIDLFFRRFFPWWPGAQKRNRIYQLEDSGYDRIMNIPYLSGCFMFLRTTVLAEVGGFDERIFMYIEDADLTRRIHQKYKTLFFPDASIFHRYSKGSYRNFKLMIYNIHGAFIYFTKWGWFFDKERRQINDRIVAEYLKVK